MDIDWDIHTIQGYCQGVFSHFCANQPLLDFAQFPFSKEISKNTGGLNEALMNGQVKA